MKKSKRKRGAQTSKNVFPCWCAAILVKSASFKKIPEDRQVSHEKFTKDYPRNDSKFIPKTIGGIFEKIIENTTNLVILGSHAGTICLALSD